MNRRKIHELNLHILKRHHSRQWHARRERVVGHLRMRVRKSSYQRRLATVGRSNERHLSHSLLLDAVDDAGVTGRFPGRLGAQFGQPPLQLGLHLLRTLVARNRRHHLFHGHDLLVRRLGALEASLGFQVNRGQVCRHGVHRAGGAYYAPNQALPPRMRFLGGLG